MASLGERLASRAPNPAVRGGEWHRTDLSGTLPEGSYDAVILSYAFGELPEEKRLPLLGRLWEHTAGVLLVLEPGTPDGFARILQARSFLLAAGASVIAPCPGDIPCPMQDGNWCHFSARVARSRIHRLTKEAELPYEDEKYAYIAAARTAGIPCKGRVLRHPQTRKGHMLLELCTKGGTVSAVVPRSRASAYRIARDLKWGDAVGNNETDLF
jgi:ribosomal protein RSM22 (predicted rRNA methylase)